MKRIAFLLLTFFFSFNSFATEIISVSRDLYYPNIFYYKYKLIGLSLINRFDFKDLPDEDAQPEFFMVKMRSKKEDIGKKVNVIFEYKSKKSNKFKEIKKEIILTKKTEKIKFIFDSESIEKYGRVELWKVKIMKNNNLLSEKVSSYNKWR